MPTLLHDPRIACQWSTSPRAGWIRRRRIEFVSDDAHGGIDVFIGRVRASSHGRQCVAIHYDMFDPLALNGLPRHRRGGGRTLRPEGEVLRRPCPRQAGGRRPGGGDRRSARRTGTKPSAAAAK